MEQPAQPNNNDIKLVAQNTKRASIDRSNKVVFIAVAAASIVVVFALVSLNFLWKQQVYNNHILKAKSETASTLETNIESINNLKETLPSLDTSSTNVQEILDALPAKYDYPALASEFNYLARTSGVSLQGSVGEDQSASAQPPSNNSTPVPISLTLNASGSYTNVKKFIQNLEYSTRQVSIQSVSLSGTNTQLSANIIAETYYQPAKTLDLSKKQVQ